MSDSPTKVKLTAWLVFALALAALMLGSRTQGNTRDEGYYFDAAPSYSGWYAELPRNLVHGQFAKSFSRRAVDRAFSYNHEHPALMKTLFGISERIFHRSLPLLNEQEAFRLPTNIVVAFMAMCVFLFAARKGSLAGGLVAATLSLAAPRLFFDAQLSCFDAPIAALWVIVVYAYFRALDDRRWGWRTGILFGLALATKHNAFFLPIILGVHCLWTLRKTRRFPTVFVWMATLGPLVYLACWPWLWFDTVARFREYVAFHVHHVYYNMEYMGVNYNKPPSPLSFTLFMELITMPLTTSVLALVGIFALAKSRDNDARSPFLLIALNAIFPMAILTLTRAPIFGATKHFHASIPFLAILAAAGYEFVAQKRRVVLAVLVCAPAVIATVRTHPYGLSDYTLPAGGVPGAADLGMNRQFWGYTVSGALPWINQHAPKNAAIYWHDTNQSQIDMDKKLKLMRSDLRNTGLEEPGVRASEIAFVEHEKHFNKYEYWIWDFYGITKPSLIVDLDGVPLLTLYQRPKTP